ncbi:hypothetical protein HMPREF0063_10047 [Aeromicrobium marinum DSM 15272]|uniref:Uncharacterized protein n=1 Tax=Aeromicrobium marinum DSM 15272 TaxID=585531 RepID=E2S7P0_9ACTN|nr:hypothetical protein [Aeromicrobium marinum]EFQ84706.1 hypothetical protein HMPREF0063_10047 [Aeromicrobium marinum DSM 15272]
MRLVLFVHAIVAVLLWAPFAATLWQMRPWYIRGVFVGLGGVLLYVLAGQAKAYDYAVPFDLVSWGGLTAMAVLNGFMAITIVRESEHRGK